MKTRISPLKTPLSLIQASLEPKPLKKIRINTTKRTINETIQRLESIPPRLLKRTRIKLITWAISSIVLISKKVTMPTTVLKSQKTSSCFSNLHVNDWKEKRRKIGIGTVYLISCDFQRPDKGLLDSGSEVNAISQTFALQLDLKTKKNYCWGSENWRYHSRNLPDDSFYLFCIG